MELDLRRFEDILKEIIRDLDYLRFREMMMRNTNESTNHRVKNFAILTCSLSIESASNCRSNFIGIDRLADSIS